MQQGPPRLRRARPVADAPIDALLLRAEDLTKGWLLALLEQAPLDDAPAILAASLVAVGPPSAAPWSERWPTTTTYIAWSRAAPWSCSSSQTGEMAGSRGVEMTARAVDTLRGVIWSALRAELTQPDADQVAELSERLNLVSELVRAAALRRVQPAPLPEARHRELSRSLRGPASGRPPGGDA